MVLNGRVSIGCQITAENALRSSPSEGLVDPFGGSQAASGSRVRCEVAVLIETDDGRRVLAETTDDLEVTFCGQPVLLVEGEPVRASDVCGWIVIAFTPNERADLEVGGYTLQVPVVSSHQLSATLNHGERPDETP